MVKAQKTSGEAIIKLLEKAGAREEGDRPIEDTPSKTPNAGKPEQKK
jgi:uncharacterized protein